MKVAFEHMKQSSRKVPPAGRRAVFPCHLLFSYSLTHFPIFLSVSVFHPILSFSLPSHSLFLSSIPFSRSLFHPILSFSLPFTHIFFHFLEYKQPFFSISHRCSSLHHLSTASTSKASCWIPSSGYLNTLVPTGLGKKKDHHVAKKEKESRSGGRRGGRSV